MLNKVYGYRDAVTLIDNGAGVVALVNGKCYDVFTFRPVDGDGRRLREDNIAIIESLRSSAIEQCRKDDENAAKTPVYNGVPREKVAEMIEDAQQSAFEAGYDKGKQEAKTSANGSQSDLINAFSQALTEALKPLYPTKEEPKAPQIGKNQFFHEHLNTVYNILSNPQISAENKYFYLYGPAGTGKSTIARQLATMLNIPFYSCKSVGDVYSLIGYMNAAGDYVQTDFYRAFANGGLFFLDEADCSDDIALKALNDALASRVYSFPCGMIEASDKFYCIAAGNTTGRGASLDYTGNRLDASTIDRFNFLFVGYDERIEKSITENDENLLDFAHSWRKATQKANVSCLFTYRTLKSLHQYITYAGIDMLTALQWTLFKGLESDDIRIIHAAAGDDTKNNPFWKTIEQAYYNN